MVWNLRGSSRWISLGKALKINTEIEMCQRENMAWLSGKLGENFTISTIYVDSDSP